MLIGIASTGNESMPTNASTRRLTQHVDEGVKHEGGTPVGFATSVVGSSMTVTPDGASYALANREIIADSIECVVRSEALTGFASLSDCDTSLSGMLMAAARLDVPNVILCGGSTITASMGEALGMSLPGSATPAADDDALAVFAQLSGRAVVAMAESGMQVRHILTKKAFENAIAVLSAMGGSTNAVLHLLAIAHEARVELELDDVDRIARRVPHIADMKPGGVLHMVDLHHVGGVPVIMKALLEHEVLHGDCPTVTGSTVEENLFALNPPDVDGQIVRQWDAPIRTVGGITVLRGSLAPTGAVMKPAAADEEYFEGSARVFDSEPPAVDAVVKGEIEPGSVIVIRHEGPKGGPGMRELFGVTVALASAGRRSDCAVVTDGRFIEGTDGFCVGHVSPEAAIDGPIALIADGDTIVIDLAEKIIDVLVDDAELDRRRSARPPTPTRPASGALAKYAKLARGAEVGAVSNG